MADRRPTAGILSAGLGALPVVERLLLHQPGVQCTLLMDSGLVGLAVLDPSVHASRVEEGLQNLRALDLDVVLAPDLAPAGAIGDAVDEALATEALSNMATGRVAVVVEPAGDLRLRSLVDRLSSAGATTVLHIAETLGPVLNRSLDRDEASVAIVRETAAAVRATGAHTAILAVPHAHLVADLFQRSLGRGVHIVDSPEIWACAIGSALGGATSRPGEPEVTVLDATGSEMSAAARRFLQLPAVAVHEVRLGNAPRELTRNDRVLLAYGAIGNGDLDSVFAAIAGDAAICWEREGVVTSKPAAEVLRACAGQAFVVDQILNTANLWGVTGRQVTPVGDLAFSHMLTFDGDLVREVRILDATLPWE
jgi:hypothetical protein